MEMFDSGMGLLDHGRYGLAPALHKVMVLLMHVASLRGPSLS